MSLAAPLAAPFYTGQGSSPAVPGLYPVALNGRGYFLDTKAGIERSTIPLLRAQADTGNLPGLQSLNPEGLWRRDQESYHHGAGQNFLDRADSDPLRFHTSKGVDVWTRWQLSLLNATTLAVASANTNLALAVAGTRLYVTDGTTVSYTTNGTAYTAVTGTGAAAPSSIASDGFKVYLAHGANGVYVTNTGSGAAAQMVTTGISSTAVLGHVKGRLMLGTANVLYNITDLVGPAAVPVALFTHPNTGWAWVGFAEGPSSIYAAGYAGDKSLIYRTSIKADGTALDVPVVAGELPDGEVVRSIQGYLGYVLLGSDKGVRFCATDSAGNLTIGALIPTTSPVLCFEPQDRFVWYGLTNYDAISTGLGRMDLSVFTATLTPAYASDLMATTQGSVASVATFGGVRYFTVSGSGFYAESTSKTTSGTLDTGHLTFGIPDEKIGMYVDVAHSTLGGGQHAVDLSVNSGAFNTIGTHTGTNAEGPFIVNQARGDTFEVRHTLTRGASLSPVLTRWSFRAYPAASSGEAFYVPLLLADRYVAGEGGGPLRDVYIEDIDAVLEELFVLRSGPQMVTYQQGRSSWPVFVKDVQWKPTHRTKDGKTWNGTATVKLITVKE